MFDELQIRCPRLGGEVTFSYCKQEDRGLPCPRTVLCWQPYIPVEIYLRKILTEEQWDRCFNRPPKDRVTTMLELIEEAKKQKRLSGKETSKPEKHK